MREIKKILFIGLFLFIIDTAFCQNQGKLQVNVVPHSLMQRSFAPIPVTVQFHWKGLGFITGRLELACYVNDTLNTVIFSDEIVVAGTSLNRNMLLPIHSEGTYVDSIELRIKFHLEDGSFIPLQSQNLPILRNSGCFSFNICEINNSYLRGRPDNISAELRLEKLAPLESSSGDLKKRNTGTTFIPVGRVPGTVFGYCAYDIVLLRHLVLRDLDHRQLSILKAWVRGGGALLVMLEDSILKKHQLDFLNDLIKYDTDSIFTGNIGDKIAYPADFPADKIGYYNPGLGRVVIANKKFNSEKAFNSPDWRHLSAFLWRVRMDRLDTVVKTGNWFSVKEIEEYKKKMEDRYNNYYDSHSNYDDLNRVDSSFINSFQNNIESFLPAEFTMIPLWLLALILLSFIIVIGPGEYILLGKFGLRKYTWISFPLICLGFAFLTVSLAEFYMGRDDHISTVTVIDEDPSGKLLRRTAYNVVFTGSSKRIARDFKKEMYSVSGQYMRHRYGRYNQAETQPLIVSGRLFTDYSVSYNYKQWEPGINRLISFDTRDADKHQWKFPRKFTMENTADLRSELYESTDHQNKSVNVAVINGNSVKFPGHNSTLPLFEPVLEYMAQKKEEDEKRVNLFSLLSSLSPSMGYAGTELMIVDPSDSDETLVLVAVYDYETHDLKIFRRIYRDKKIKPEKNQGREINII